MEYLESAKQTQAESHLLPYQRFATDGRRELERDPEMQSQAELNHFNASDQVDSTCSTYLQDQLQWSTIKRRQQI